MKFSNEKLRQTETSVSSFVDSPIKKSITRRKESDVEKLSRTEKRAIKPGLIYKCDNPEDEDSGSIPTLPEGTEIYWTSSNIKTYIFPHGRVEIVIRPESKEAEISYLKNYINVNHRINRVHCIFDEGVHFSGDYGSHENNLNQALRIINLHYDKGEYLKIKQIKLVVE